MIDPLQRSTTLFLWVGAVLLLASVIAKCLRVFVERNQAHPTIDNLVARINAWWVMVLVLAFAFLFGQFGVTLLFFLLSFWGLREFVTAAYSRIADHRAMAAAFYLILPLQYYFVYTGWYGMFSIFVPVYGFLLLSILAAVGSDVTRFLERSATLQWGLMMTVFAVSHVPALFVLEIPDYDGHPLLLIAYLVLVVQSSDVFQYIWGKLLGKRKLAPQLSPSKTLEGLVLGIISAVVLGVVLTPLTPFSHFQSAAIAAVLCMMGFFGGLVMSAIKRDRGIKDWGDLIAGHGGVLDRLDSVVFAAPVYFHLIRYWWVP